MPDEDFPEHALSAMHFCTDHVTSGDLDEVQAIRKVHAELEALQKIRLSQINLWKNDIDSWYVWQP